jgi:L-aminopeptidase/D-esterase-like protein
MTGTTWLEERGLVSGPILITNTHSVGVVRDAAVSWMVDRGWKAEWHLPVVAETYDGGLNDINGFHVTKDHALEALRKAKSGAVREGAVGGGTGMICNGFKGGIGTASRVVQMDGETFTVGVLVQCNYNWTKDALRIGGVPVGMKVVAEEGCFTDRNIKIHDDWFPFCDEKEKPVEEPVRDGSIIIVVATDAPLLPHQLKRVAKRPTLALGRLGTWSNAGSGDIFIAFSTASGSQISEEVMSSVAMYPNYRLSVLFQATVEATEEAIVNAMVAAETMIGASGLKVEELPEDQLKNLMTLSP